MKRLILLFLLNTFCFSIVARPPELINFGNSCYVNALLQALYASSPLTQAIPELVFESVSVGERYKDLVISFIHGNKYEITTELFKFYAKIQKDEDFGKTLFKDGSKPKPAPQENLEKQKAALQAKGKLSDFEQATLNSLQSAMKESKDFHNLAENIAKNMNENWEDLPKNEQGDQKKEIEEVLTSFFSAGQEDANEFCGELIGRLIEDVEQKDKIKKIFLFNVDDGEYHSASILNMGTFKELRPITFNTFEGKILIDNIKTFDFLNEIFEEKLKGTAFYSFPEIFILSLERSVNGIDITNEKNHFRTTVKTNHIIAIPFDLNTHFIRDDSNDDYELFAVIIHTGTGLSGHYFAYIKEETEWFLCNDSVIRPVSQAKVKEEMEQFGRMLFYKRVSPEQQITKRLQTLHEALQDLLKQLQERQEQGEGK